MDKEYILAMLELRIVTLNKRYKLACHGKDDNGVNRGTYAMANTRTVCKKESHLCVLIKELIEQIKGPICDLSEEAQNGLEKLIEPIERHRRLKDEVLL
jgi:hypothetical protein